MAAAMAIAIQTLFEMPSWSPRAISTKPCLDEPVDRLAVDAEAGQVRVDDRTSRAWR